MSITSRFSSERKKELPKAAADVWWKESASGALARLHQKKKGKNKVKAAVIQTYTVKTFTNQEPFQAIGEARFRMQAQRQAEGKWRRTEEGYQLEQLENKAVESVELNGRGDFNAKVVVVSQEDSYYVSSSKQKKRKHHSGHENEEEMESTQQASRDDSGSESEISCRCCACILMFAKWQTQKLQPDVNCFCAFSMKLLVSKELV